jgi:hypothetical protein
MDEVICHNDPGFLNLLSNMRNGSVTEQDSELLLSRCLDKLPSNERRGFDNALWLVPTWKEANRHIFNHLQHIMTSPIAKINAQLHTSRSDGKNCCIQSNSYPLKNVLCVGAKVMLQKNFVVERKLMNGSIRHVKAICYKHPAGPKHNTDNDVQYVIVDFPQCIIPAVEALIPGILPTCVPIPVVTERCKKNAVPFVHYHFDVVWYSLFTKVMELL